MEKSTSLTRVCIVCGEEKPLAAYLQISGAQGTLYGNVCAACRAASANKPAASGDDEDSGGGGGYRIDAKTKIQTEQEDKKRLKQQNELNKKEAKERAKIVTDKTERTEVKEKAEKDHREHYIEDKKKHDFLSYQSKKTQQATAAKKSHTQQTADTRFTSEQERQSAETKTQKEEVTHEEQKKSTIDLSAAAFDFDPQRSGLKYGEIFRQWGKSATTRGQCRPKRRLIR